MNVSSEIGPGASVLLHTCCAPCAGAIAEALSQSGAGTAIFFSNSNITPRAEYDRRLAEVYRLAERFGLEVIEDEYDHDAWKDAVRGLEDEPERGGRCLQCFRYRLSRAAAYASSHGFDTLTTALASSRWKSLEQVDEAGREACAAVEGVQWWGRNWRKGGGQVRRDEINREMSFYNQTFCGCEYSNKKI